MGYNQTDTDDQTQDDNHSESLRLDVFLYRTRLLKTRGLAGKIISKGKVRVTRHDSTLRTKKSHTAVRVGDGISFMRGQTLLDLTITALPHRRGPAAEARACYILAGTNNPDSQNSADMSCAVDKPAASRQIGATD